MKLVKAIIRPDKVEAVKGALAAEGVAGMTVTEVRGFGQQKGHTAVYRGQEYNVSLLPKMEVEVVVADHLAASVCTAIIDAARTGEIGDGRVFVLEAPEGYRIRTGEVDYGV
jgi:nitrogen regulatory protein PII